MCGIAGYCGLDKPELLSVMNKAQVHRGPDGEGEYVDGKVGLAHRRLAIIDVETGQQPMTLDDGSLSVVFNGEIYNFLELRKELEAAGSVFKTRSDTEVLLHGFRAWGDDLWDKLNGMFALALYDKTDQSVRLVRDHFGIKPLYYTQPEPGVILFASEIKSLLASGYVERMPNDRSIYRYLAFRIQDDGEETFFRDIKRLESGKLLICQNGKVKIKSYTNLEQELASASENLSYDDKAIDEFYQAFKRSIMLRLQSEVPVGTSLSGGLDSSAVAAVIAEELDSKDSSDVKAVGQSQQTFSAVFPNSSNDEESYVDAFLELYKDKITPHKIEPKADQFIEDLIDFVRTQEEPIVSTGPYAQYQVMRQANKEVTVLLDGQGADEMMAGYIPYYFVYFRQLKASRQYGRLIIEALRSSDILYRMTKSTIRERLSRRKNIAMRSLMDKNFYKSYQNEKFSVISSNLKARLVQDLFHHSIPSLLRYEDKNTMRFSLEGRVPFLDKELIKTLFRYEDKAIIHGGLNKRILRDSMKGRLPEKIRSRRNKIGFTTPEHEWTMKLRKEFYTVFNSQSFTDRPYFDGAAVLSAFEGFIHGHNDTNTMMFWRIMNIELWLREFIDDPVEIKKKDELVKKSLYEPNEGRKLDIEASNGTYRRFSVQTDRVSSKTDLNNFVENNLKDALSQLESYADKDKLVNKPWSLYVSEKIVAITQNRSYFIWDIEAGFWARNLSRFVTRTPVGIGLGSPWTMEIAIREVGLMRILYASIGSILGRLIGKRGVFYNLAGSSVRAIDGPTQYSVFPANVSAKLPPRDPEGVASQLAEKLRKSIPDQYAKTFEGVVVIDANDIGQNILGSSIERSEKDLAAVFGDNPLGQGREQTPLALVFKIDD